MAIRLCLKKDGSKVTDMWEEAALPCACPPEGGCKTSLICKRSTLDKGRFEIGIVHEDSGAVISFFLDGDGMKELRRDLKYMLKEAM